MTTIKERVQAGAEFLDKALPDWWNGKETPTLDLEILNMNNQSMCVLGQCFGHYDIACKKLGIAAWTVDERKGKPSAQALGFLGAGLTTSSLDAPWRREIRRRRREG